MSNQIGRFEIVSEFTHSDLISVYKASDPESGQTVALKAVPLATLGEHASTVVQAVLEEVEASKGLNSHNITALNGASEIDGHLCASMEYVQGNSIATMLARKEGFSIWDLQDIARQACQGLDHARVHKVLHYSLEPAKIMVQWDGIVKILSYGVSRMSSDAALAAARATTVFHYMSPEQLRGEGVDARSNIFSLGAILYEMMTEHKAFEGESIDQIRQAVLETMPTAVHLVNRKIHSGLSAVIMKALAKDPKERYDSGQDLINDLEKCKENPAKPTLGAKPAVGKPAPSMAKPPVAPTPAPKPPVQPAAFKAAAAAGSPAFTHSPKTAPSPAEFMSRAAESVSEPAAQMSVAAEEEVAAPKITVDPMVDEGHHPATKGPSFSDINELPPLKEVYVAPEPPPAHPVAEQPEPVETVQAKAVVFKNAAPAKPKTPPSVVAASRLHAHVRVPRLDGGARAARGLRRTALLRLVREARRPAGRAARLGRGPAAAGPGAGKGRRPRGAGERGPRSRTCRPGQDRHGGRCRWSGPGGHRTGRPGRRGRPPRPFARCPLRPHGSTRVLAPAPARRPIGWSWESPQGRDQEASHSERSGQDLQGIRHQGRRA